ncbi:SDR family oxidoreductase [Streptomyces triticirhizae]|uniref:SDR family oxidoreductase n=1 Tax=Streptomyces triticirhizae TaxID=2483353 RepID=A0A3M2LCB0_9ACTN|nr:SDR family oxidoreductase [Streptomyces triticirhizae]RMI34726.1 SDR family oxidoreductase [Streptomyces triticirhizae]
MSTSLSPDASPTEPRNTTNDATRDEAARHRPLAGRVAVVSGASSGIGAATAEHLAELGARVALLARRVERLDALAARVDAAGGTALPLAVDVTDEAAVQAAAKRVAAELGDADLVLNNAGVMLPSPVEAVATDVWRRQLDLNAGGVLNVVGAFVPQLLRSVDERGVADLVNVSSVAAFGVFARFAVYSGTKAFVSHMSRNLRAELGPRGVRVTALEPGIVGTELQDHVTDENALEWLASTRSQHEWLVPEDIATTVGFLASLPPRVNLQQLTVLPTGQV